LEKLAMKKTLIALAALAATGAYAQSSVTIDGVMDAGYQSLKYKGNSVTGFAGNGSATSQINFRGTQDLGGGLKASFRVETDWNTTSNNGNTGNALGTSGSPATGNINAAGTPGSGPVAASFGNGEIRTGISGAFGAVDIGAVNNAQLTAFLTGQPFGTAVGSAFRGIFATNAASLSGSVVRFDNSARYTTPNIAGFSATLLSQSKNNKSSVTQNNGTLGNYNNNGVSEFSLNYNNGPINGTFASTKETTVTTVAGASGAADFKLNTIGANYDLGVAKLFVLNQKATGTDSKLSRAATTFSATMPLGAAVLMAQIGSAKDSGTAGNGQKSKLTAFGADYNLSKTTALYARFESITDDGGMVVMPSNLPGLAGETKRTRNVFGLRVGF